ncbi:LptA/OstA family protein [Hyphobacterium marinum]|uniref:LptA/OstA family protein n=1 Tax=Hyphobacterium marinum TaxID=3116574 RepID=A0ABU7LVL8_9PROT|nr:LptA/OstA family protein [Hyphobacterium sp. Y6023]MEE2565225.1 LptA/OstA family protein [Hyphobacterium sp. Y6023]
MMSRLCLALAALAMFAASAEAQIGRQGGPMDITSDRLEVIDAESRAIFSGNVDAAQGDTRLRADEIQVFFDQNSRSAASAASGFGEVQRVIATGEVFYVTPEEVARGDRAVYQIATETITMTGNVVLTRGENVITGSCLVADLATGRSQVNPPQCGGSDGEPATTSAGRVRAVLFPSSSGEEENESDGDTGE